MSVPLPVLNGYIIDNQGRMDVKGALINGSSLPALPKAGLDVAVAYYEARKDAKVISTKTR